MNTLPTINDIQVSVVNYKSVPVVSTGMLANFYNTEIKNIQNNFARNKDRFIENKHFFKLEGEELKVFKHFIITERNENELTLLKMVSQKAKSLILWTERGAARHAKMLETDQAWEVFEKLEDNYFNQQKIIEQHEHVPSKECDFELLEKNLTRKVMHLYDELTNEIIRLGGNVPKAPSFDRRIFCQAYMTHLITSRRVRLLVDLSSDSNVSLIPSESWIIDSENIMHVIGDRDGVKKELLPGIIKAAASRLE